MSYPPQTPYPPPHYVPPGTYAPLGQQPFPGAWPQQAQPGQAHHSEAPYVAPHYATPAWPYDPAGGQWADPLLPNPGSRLAARLVDVVSWLLSIVAFGVLDAFVLGNNETAGPALLIAWAPVSGVLLLAFPLSRGGATLGKRLLRLRVVRVDGTPVGFWRALGRETFWLLANAIPIFNWINGLYCMWDKPLQQCVHDKVADTRVIRRS